MPPKVVYGKWRNGERTAFTKFLSPEREATQKGVEGQNAASSAEGDWREQLLAAAAAAAAEPEESEKQLQNNVSVLQQGLEGLHIEQRRDAKEKDSAKKTIKAQKVKPSRDVDVIKENISPVEDGLEQSMQALTIDAAGDEGRDVSQKSQRPRKVLSDRNINAETQLDGSVVTVAKQKKQKKRVVPSSVASPKSKSPQRRQQLPTPEPTPEPDDLYSTYASLLLALSDRKKIVAFQDWADQLEPHFEVSKIAEASFSEVYRLSSISSTNGVKEESVLKVVALKTPPTVPLPCQLHGRAVRDLQGQIEKETAQREEDDQWKSQVEDVLSEVNLLQNLTHIPGFTVFRDLTLVQGRPSASFNDAWKEWNKARPRGKKSEFPDPSKKSSYDEYQLWAVVEMQDAGTDCEKLMESGGLASIWEVWDVFWGVAISIGKAEEACRFEHRDLHLGNICVRSSRAGADVLEPCIKDPLRRKLRFTGLDTTVIDYTLSRADMVAAPPSRRLSSLSHISSSTASSIAQDAADVAYMDLDKDPAIFEGDATEEYQYDIYRYMRGIALSGNPLQFQHPLDDSDQAPEQQQQSTHMPHANNTHIRFDEDDDTATTTTTEPPHTPWRAFHPKSNLIWLHFLLHKLLKHLSSLSRPPHHHCITAARLVFKEDADQQDTDKVPRKAAKLFKVLTRVAELLCPVALGRENALGSVKELVVLALEERWVRVGDVAG
ncbi:uncharacterized protein SETTUDRAFT_155837 [Exserohilum turcica Et28A]|uniref:non-specific serine/threonine protein kinase n=1 Tax=Exserohilum turcicum (strain 28A) TaxID=671987 RepID=R0JQ24_EXST2|nr:uncharacterized protein SETTUDRAFT_155837 [Exserohilum turcica Et28A]EOA83283.1 hypothetical protein SETTUDRAFT_155837 [Exserohilum turcica Et28A]